MASTDEDRLEAAKRRHRELTQLQVSHSLRGYQREWFATLQREVFEQGRPYVICGALSPHEIFEALDLSFMTDVWYSGLVAARRQSAYYSDFLGKRGYHDGLRRYSGLAFAVALDEDNPDKPWGGLPKPALVVNGVNDRSGEALADHFGIPYFGIEMPTAQRLHPNWWEMSRWQWEDSDEPYRIDLMVGQYKEIVAEAESIAGKKLDLDRLRQILDRVNYQEEYFDEVRTIICNSPKLPVRLGEVMSQVMGIQWHRGTEWALNQARAFRDEVKMRAENQMWVCPNEKYRLMWVGEGLWQNLDFFADFEDSHGVVFARSNYLSIASDGYLRYGLHDPLRALASRYVTASEQMHIPPWSSAWAIWEAKRHRISGGLQVARWEGYKFIPRALEANGIPMLELPIDAVDARRWDDAKVHQMVSDFIERRVIPTAAAHGYS